jgi:hypothetical protein
MTAGAFQATVTGTSAAGSNSVSVFVVVGADTDVNSVNGQATTAVVGSGQVTISVSVALVTGAVSASTVFSDTIGRDAPITGLIFARSATAAAVTVATSTALDALSNPLSAKSRKMFAVSALAAGVPSALPAAPSSGVSSIKVTGHFFFSPSKPDSVAFSGSIQLPAGFNPSASGGNSLVVGLGNIVDSVSVDAKGKPIGTATGAAGHFKSVSVKYPRLSGQAVGGEKATLSATMSLPQMDAAGFDTEGITQKLRPDETKLKSVSRFMQASFLLGGVAYEAYIPVVYKLAKGGTSGQISARSGTH